MAYSSQQILRLKPNSRSLDLSIGRPLLGDSLEEVSATLGKKLGRTDLQTFLLQPHPDTVQALGTLRNVLSLPTTKAQMNQRDGHRLTPLDYATRAFPEAAELLLQAGASPRSSTYLLHQNGPDKWKVVSPLIRAGYPTDERSSQNFGCSPLHSVAASRQPSYRHALELVRHGGHLLNWDARDDNGCTPLRLADIFAKRSPGSLQRRLIRMLFQTRRVPPHAQYISSFDGERLMDAAEAATHPRISLIDTALAGDVESIGPLISAGAMVNERDEAGLTLLHLIAMGDSVPNAYHVTLELLRHGGWAGVDWDAVTEEGMTARQLAKLAWKREDLDDGICEELARIRGLLRKRCLPPGESYVFPCMDPKFCHECGTLPCTYPENDVRGMPGSLY